MYVTALLSVDDKCNKKNEKSISGKNYANNRTEKMHERVLEICYTNQSVKSINFSYKYVISYNQTVFNFD